MNFIKTSTTHEVEVADRKYQFVIPAGAPLGEAYDVAFKFLMLISEQAKMTADNLKPQEAKSEEVNPEIVK